MKKIQFKKIKLLNFCGIRNAEYEFGEHLTTISGGNGKGKTTLASAITYTLFGTDIKGAALDIKTYDKEHNIIREIEHSSELILSVDGEEITLKRSLLDSWKGDSVKNNYKYYINGDITTAGDFKKTVDEICPEVTFRLTSSATDFCSRPWSDQRQFLQTMVGGVSQEDVTHGDAKFDIVLEALKSKDIEAYIKHIKYKKSEVQKQLDNIPVRLSELKQALPEEQDWGELERSLKKNEVEIQELNAQLAFASNNAASDVAKNIIRDKLGFANKRKDNIEQSARNLAEEEAVKHQSDVLSSNAAYAKAEQMVSELKAKMDGFTDTEVNTKAQMDDIKADMKKLGDNYSSWEKRTWSWNDNESFCSHCGQALPPSQVAKLKEDSFSRFNEEKAEKMKEILEVAETYKKRYAEMKAIIEQIDEDRKVTTNQLANAQKALHEAETNRENIKKEAPRSVSEILASRDDYKQICDDVVSLTEQFNAPADVDKSVSEHIDELKAKLATLKEEYNRILTCLSGREYYDKVLRLITEASNEKTAYQEQIDKLDESLSVAKEYYNTSCQMLEDKVNKLFSYVKWTMFQANLDGERKPYCECYHDGVPYSRLNGAAKVNAGIDIAYTIAKFYEVSVPMILDECESNLAPIYKDGQQIRLCVAPTEELEVTYGD